MSKPSLLERFESEIQEVQSTLLAATSELTNPLGELVRAQIRRSQPPICAATVLAVSMPTADMPATGEMPPKRILLAAALEMLHVALNVHRLLVNAAINEQGNDSPLDRAFIGSTILAGDYCFSRAAQLAAQTDHPRVVTTFSLALQTVSEELLREQFLSENAPANSANAEAGSYDETRHLLQSGAQAAALLIDLPVAEQEQAISRSQELAAQWSLYKADTEAEAFPSTFSSQQAYPLNWQVLYQWLIRQRSNGEVTTLSTPLSSPPHH
jgi:octaprenyl-diphosphate synthase